MAAYLKVLYDFLIFLYDSKIWDIFNFFISILTLVGIQDINQLEFQ